MILKSITMFGKCLNDNIDIPSGLIEYPKIEFHVMDTGKLEFPDNSFDYIYSS